MAIIRPPLETAPAYSYTSATLSNRAACGLFRSSRIVRKSGITDREIMAAGRESPSAAGVEFVRSDYMDVLRPERSKLETNPWRLFQTGLYIGGVQELSLKFPGAIRCQHMATW